MSTNNWPTHAYVPGKTMRHPEGAFDGVRDTVKPDLTIEQLAECEAFVSGLNYIQSGFFWEAHEVLEPVWMILPDPSRERAFVQGVIQIANGLLKLEMGRPKAAARLLVISTDLLAQADHPPSFRNHTAQVVRFLEALRAQVDMH
ncbi:DUF309 domain-containing protein [Planktotalea sp.]|uniref:DUF309 domain-containing protein n=1 Tax=Planktotalea sp. TaxID=2029877 RepID=UPI003F6A7AC7